MREKQKLIQAKKLRRDMTESEKKLWYFLRAHRFKGFKFKRQCPVGPYIVDFVALTYQVIVELDGGQHAINSASEEKRTEYLRAKNFTVLRFWNDELLQHSDLVLDKIWGALHSPLPNPLPQAGEGIPRAGSYA